MDLDEAVRTRQGHRGQIARGGRAICIICGVAFPCWAHRNARMVVIAIVRDRYFGPMPRPTPRDPHAGQ